jgi:hypothetical protein
MTGKYHEFPSVKIDIIRFSGIPLAAPGRKNVEKKINKRMNIHLSLTA